MDSKMGKAAPRQSSFNAFEAAAQNPRFGTSRGQPAGFGSMAGCSFGGSAGHGQMQSAPVNPFNFGTRPQDQLATARGNQSKNKRSAPTQMQRGSSSGRWQGPAQYSAPPVGAVNTGQWFPDSLTVPWGAHQNVQPQPEKESKRSGSSQDTVHQQHVDTDEGKRGKPNFCFRCFTKGHGTTNCQAVVFREVCESNEHVKQKCPVMKAPKMVAQWVGYAADGDGFYHIPHAPMKNTSDHKTTRISVEGGQQKRHKKKIEERAEKRPQQYM
ncbi:uncharacterized protein C2845_PM01G47570 [Panicum miliaceum]|uniref:CCHC-type domain-containing protein n=1 Tax=Panicum miliaceum TaxID=4540 RepID=A0A3L6TVJ0_PANMI|nr:uncharacterized protein C2845_PM01G47570 [Panicum miliaceum]